MRKRLGSPDRRQILRAGAGALATLPLAAPHVARAQANWPDKPVRIIVPFAAGGGTDILARPWAEALGKVFNQQFVIENRGGASGMIGTEAAAKAAPDGYAFLFTGATTTVAIPLMRQVNYDYASLMPIARMGDVVTGFVIDGRVGPKTLPEVLEHARKNPGKLAFGSSGNATTPHLRYEAFRLRTGVDILHVPYRGGADSLTDLLAGSIQLMNEPVTLPHVRAGKLHLFVVNHAKRMAEWPNVPTMTEAGYPDSDIPIWFTLWAPGGTSKEIVQRLNAECVKIAATADMRAKIEAAGCEPVIQTVEEIAAFREKDRTALAALIKAANIKME
jgi:tripartite-type tricarboxylate transporter receptor subunit TctC